MEILSTFSSSLCTRSKEINFVILRDNDFRRILYILKLYHINNAWPSEGSVTDQLYASEQAILSLWALANDVRQTDIKELLRQIFIEHLLYTFHHTQIFLPPRTFRYLFTALTFCHIHHGLPKLSHPKPRCWDWTKGRPTGFLDQNTERLRKLAYMDWWSRMGIKSRFSPEEDKCSLEDNFLRMDQKHFPHTHMGI